MNFETTSHQPSLARKRKKPLVALLFEFAMLWGGERSILAVLPSLQQSFDFVAFAPEKGLLPNALRELGIEIKPILWRDDHNQKLPIEKIHSQIEHAMTSEKVDLIHANSLTGGRTLGAIASHLEVLCTAHLRDIFGLSKTAIRNINGCDRLVAVSTATKNFHVKQGLDSEKTDVIYNGVDLENFQPRLATGSLHQELGLSNDKKFAILIAQIGLRKGHDILAESVAICLKKESENVQGDVSGEIRKWHFVIVGKRGSISQECIEFEKQFEERFCEVGLKNHLHLLGERHDVSALMNECDLLVHPAKQEPLGRVLLEAAASGLPILTTDVGGTPEIVRNRHSAMLVPPNDANGFANGLLEMIQNDKLRDALSLQARQDVAEKFSVSNSATQLAAFWNRLLPSC